jgi:large subunit ribosomal protein L22
MTNDVTFQAEAKLRNLRVTAQKSRRVVNLIRDKSVAEARAILKFSPQAVAEPILKLLNSAVSNILVKSDRNGLKVTESRLFILEIFVDEGPTMKRFRPRARGTASRILKRTSHITIVAGTTEELNVPALKRAPKKEKDSTTAADTAVDQVDGTAKTDEADAAAEDKQAADASDPSKAPGKAKKSVGPKKISATHTNKTAKKAVTKQKKGA